MGGVFLIQENDALIEMKEQDYDSEDVLQELLAKYPNLLAGDQMDSSEPRKWLLVSREMRVPDEEAGANRWSLDHLFLDQEGIPTLIEVKRSSDTRIRREVVGQMLDYASNAVVYWPVETILAQYEKSCEERGVDPVKNLADFLEDGLLPEQFWQRVKTNLQAGCIRMVFVADEIPPELRRVVEFLNLQMDPAEVLAVEIRQYIGEKLKLMVPRVVGQTAEASGRKKSPASARIEKGEDPFFKELEAREGAQSVSLAKEILEWSKKNVAYISWGSGSFIPVFEEKDVQHYPITVRVEGRVNIQFRWLKPRPPFNAKAKRLDLLRKLNSIPGISIGEDRINGIPNFPLTTLSNPTAMKQFLSVLDWIVQEMKQ